MNNLPTLFTQEQGNLLIRLLLAHITADFILQNNAMVTNKKWFSKHMFMHIAVVMASTFLLTFSWEISMIIVLMHWLIDGLKCSLQQRYNNKEPQLFFADQLMHLLSIIGLWVIIEHIQLQITKVLTLPFTNYNISLLLLAYIFVMWPVGYALKFALKGIAKTTTQRDEEKLEHGGKLIGMFERMIILTFVLLSQYEAIGFLITGKSIIRFAQKEENLRSEYVLVGTMMSYAVSILTGVLINGLLKLNG